jgi:flagellar hook-associated protein FlgK
MILVYVITAVVLAAGAIFYNKMVKKFKQEIADQKAIVTALQAHVDALSKKRDQLVRDLRNATSVNAKKASEFPVATTVTETVAPVKKKKVYKRKPKSKVEA